MRKKLLVKAKVPKMKVLRTEKNIVTTVRQLKRKYNDLPLSYLYGIDDEIDFQCPIIDEYIEKIAACKESLAKAKRAKSMKTKSGHILKAMYAIEHLDSNLDVKTRGNFIAIREYADQWKSLAIELLNASKTPESFMKK